MKILWCASLMVGLLVSVNGPAPGQVSANPDRQLEAQVDAYTVLQAPMLRWYLRRPGSFLIVRSGQ